MQERPRAPSLYALPPWPEEPLGSALSPALLAEEAAYGLTHDVAWAYAEAIPALVGGDPGVDVIPLAFRRGAIRAALVEAPVVVPGLYHAETTSPAVAEALRDVVPSVVVSRASPTAACWAFQRPVARRFLPVVPLDFDVWLCWDRKEARACVVQGFSTIVEGRWGPRGVAPEAAPPPWAEPDAAWGGHGWAASLLDNRSDRTPKRVFLDPARGFLYLAADAERGSDYPARVAAAWRAGAGLDGPTSTSASAVCAALRFVDGHAELAWIGDGRVLRLRGERLERLTRDHDIADALARGDLVLERCPPEALRALVRTLPSHAPETCRVAVAPGDRFVLLDAAGHEFLEARLGGHDALRRFLRGSTSTAAPAQIAAALRDAVAGVPNAYPVVIIDAAASVLAVSSPPSAVPGGRADAVIAPRAASSPAPIAAELRVVWGAELRRPYFLTGPARIGRGSDCDIVLDDDGVSRHHAQITPADGGYLLTDLGATNGIWVNHVRLAPGTRHRLGEGDVLTLGAHRLQFWLGHRTIWEPHLRRHDVSPILGALAAAGPSTRGTRFR
jgi:hypothetical protein